MSFNMISSISLNFLSRVSNKSLTKKRLQIILKRSYYVRPKKKETKGSWQAWATMGAVTVGISGLAVYALGEDVSVVLILFF